MTSTAKTSSVVHPPMVGWPARNWVQDFAIRKDGSYVILNREEGLGKGGVLTELAVQSGPNGVPLPGGLSRLVSGFDDGFAPCLLPVGVSVLPSGMSVALVDALNSCVRIVSWPSNSVVAHSDVIEHPKTIAARPDGIYLVAGDSMLWEMETTENSTARILSVKISRGSPLAALPNGSAIVVLDDASNEDHQDIAEVTHDRRVLKIAPVREDAHAEPNYNGRLSDACFSNVADFAVDIKGRIVVLDEIRVSKETLVASGMSRERAETYELKFAVVRIIDRTSGAVRTLELVDQKGKPISQKCWTPGQVLRSVDLGATLPSGGRIAIDGNGNIVFASTNGFELITNTGLAPGLTAYNGHDQRKICDLEEEIERLRSQLKNSRPLDMVDMVGNSEGVTRQPSSKRTRSGEPKSALQALHKNNAAMVKVKKEAREEVADAERKVRNTRRKLECTICMEETEERVALEPCGHVLCCFCAERLSICPTCGQAVLGRHRIYS